jgi:hypothetical protein
VQLIENEGINFFKKLEGTAKVVLLLCPFRARKSKVRGSVHRALPYVIILSPFKVCNVLKGLNIST